MQQHEHQHAVHVLFRWPLTHTAAFVEVHHFFSEAPSRDAFSTGCPFLETNYLELVWGGISGLYKGG